MAFLRKRFTLTELRDQELTALLNNICSPSLMIASGWILDAIALGVGVTKSLASASALTPLNPPAPVRVAHGSGGVSRILTLFPPLLWPKATGERVRG
jgi:hypothetical protein